MSFLHLRPGDPTPVGYATVLCYALAAWLCWRAARVDRRSRQIWWLLAALMLACGINKQLDLQTTLTDIGRYMARRESWYDRRRTVQLFFILALIMSGVAGGLMLLHVARKKPWQTRLAMSGAMVLVVFILIRAASFHHVDLFLGTNSVGIAWNAVLEIGGILLVAAGAWARLRRFAPRR